MRENKEKKTNRFLKLFSRKNAEKVGKSARPVRIAYSTAIVALVLAAIVLVNWLVSSLSKRFDMEIDISADQSNSISEENLNYVKSLKTPVTITVFANEKYYSDYIGEAFYYSHNGMQVQCDSSYYDQTLRLLSRYSAVNDSVTLKFVDPNATERTAVTSKYGECSYGDIIISADSKGEERYKILTFEDIYELEDNSMQYYYGMSQYAYAVTGNKVEKAVTGAIAYVSSADKNAVLLTGHSATDYTGKLSTLLEDNNYNLNVVEDKILSAKSIPEKTDLVVLMAPSTDFLESELTVLSEFLENDGNLSKGMLFFADPSVGRIPNLYDFLEEWGIVIEDGMVFETDDRYHMPDQPMTVGMYPADEEEELTSGIGYAISGYNVPMTAGKPIDGAIMVSSLMTTSPGAVVAPLGAGADWNGYSENDLAAYSGVIQAMKEDYDDENNYITSYVMAFSSIEFIQSDWAEQSDDIANKKIVLGCADRAANVGETGIEFITRTIGYETFTPKESTAKVYKIIFMFALPIVVLALGIFIYIRRRNAE